MTTEFWVRTTGFYIQLEQALASQPPSHLYSLVQGLTRSRPPHSTFSPHQESQPWFTPASGPSHLPFLPQGVRFLKDLHSSLLCFLQVCVQMSPAEFLLNLLSPICPLLTFSFPWHKHHLTYILIISLISKDPWKAGNFGFLPSVCLVLRTVSGTYLAFNELMNGYILNYIFHLPIFF